MNVEPDPAFRMAYRLYYTWFTYSGKRGDWAEQVREPGTAHHLDDWGPKGGHEYPYWHRQMWEYVDQYF